MTSGTNPKNSSAFIGNIITVCSTMDDGWDDDVDLDVIDDEGDENSDGWGDDDDLNFDDDEVEPQITNPPLPPAPPTQAQVPSPQTALSVPAAPATVPPPTQTDGWDEDDDDLDFDTEDWGEESPTKETQNSTVEAAVPEEPPLESAGNFGADFVPPANESSTGGWEDDDDLFGDDDNDNAGVVPVTRAPLGVNPKIRDIHQRLDDYVNSLDRMLSSINAILEFEYNTPEKAHELVEYYASRPNLAEYTRTKELSRMEYQVVLPYGHVETDKNEIGQNLLPDESFVARCANQSLLADLLHVITGSDLLVRPQFLAICVAHWCKFTIHLGDGRDMVDCACHLHLSLPTSEGQRLDIAELKVSIVFAPHQPMVEFRVNGIDVVLQDRSLLTSTAEFLHEMEGHFDELPGHEDIALQNAPADIFRDAFLENSQKLFTQSTAGMKSALQQMESVVNLKSKLNLVNKGLSSFLPDSNDLLAAEEEAAALAASLQQRHSQQRQQQNIFGLPPTQPQPPAETSQGPPPQQPREPQRQPLPPPSAAPEDRPKSILGGLMSTGWSALTKSVALADDDLDPAIYGSQDESKLSLYRKEETAGPILYRQEKTQPKMHVHGTEATSAPRQPPHKDFQTRVSPPVVQQPSLEEVKTGTSVPQHQTHPISQPPPQSPKPEVESSRPPSVPPQQPTEQGVVQPKNSDELKPEKSNELVHPNDEDGAATKEINTNETSKAYQEVSLEDGWGDDDDVDVDDAFLDSEDPQTNEDVIENIQPDVTEESTNPDAKVHLPKPEERSELADVDYNPEDDIIETRKRWINPRPHRPYIKY